MKLKVYVIVGYLVSSLLTILGLIWAINKTVWGLGYKIEKP